jgi:hypothetical protein
MSDQKELTKRILAALSPSDEINVKKLRKQILLQLQTDSDDKAAKKTFKKAIQSLESEGKLTLDKEGSIKFAADSSDAKSKKKDKKAKDKKEKKEKKSKRKKGDNDDEETDHEEQPKDKKIKLDANEEEEVGDETETEETPPQNTESSTPPADKNKPCPGNPSGYTRLFLGNLPFAVDEASLRTFLSPAIMTHVKWITDKETGKFYGKRMHDAKITFSTL